LIGFFARLVPIALRAKIRQDGSTVSRVSQRVRPGEIDINLHMNQAVYPRVFELGRTHWFIRSGAWKRWRAKGINPMVAEQTLTYRHELKPFTRYTIDTRAVGVDGRFLITEGHIVVGNRVHTKGVARLLFVGPNGVLPADEVEALTGWTWTDRLPVDNWTVSS
jgi:acyl-CoA thioesterase FadM